MRAHFVIAALVALHRPALADSPVGYWEGKATVTDTPLKDKFRTLTRSATVDLWFTVRAAPNHTFVVEGEAEATYSCELKVEKLPSVSVPAPGGSVKFAPEVGGKLTDADPRRTFAITGTLVVGDDGKGTLVLAKVTPPPRTAREKLDDEARRDAPDAPLHFSIRADPGVSAGFTVPGVGKVNAKRGKVDVESHGVEVGAESDADPSGMVIEIPMTPFSPFTDAAGTVTKRPGGPFVATFEDKTKTHAIVWSAKQQLTRSH